MSCVYIRVYMEASNNSRLFACRYLLIDALTLLGKGKDREEPLCYEWTVAYNT